MNGHRPSMCAPHSFTFMSLIELMINEHADNISFVHRLGLHRHNYVQLVERVKC